jgi:hypothetical protein
MPKRTFVVLIAVCLLLGLSTPLPAAGEEYEFSIDWTKAGQRSKDWRVVLRKFIGKEDVHGLEIGSFEGRSAIWFLNNILTKPSSKLTCIDIFPEEYDTVFDHNIRVSGHQKRVIKKKGFSRTFSVRWSSTLTTSYTSTDVTTHTASTSTPHSAGIS